MDHIFPKNWSFKLLEKDFKKNLIEDTSLATKYYNLDYLEAYEHLFNHKKRLTPFQQKVFEIFKEGEIMLYFEDAFLYFLEIEEVRDYDLEMLEALKKLSSMSILEWNDHVREYGAANIGLFISDTISYFVFKEDDYRILKFLKLKPGLRTDLEAGFIGPSFLRRNLIKSYINQ